MDFVFVFMCHHIYLLLSEIFLLKLNLCLRKDFYKLYGIFSAHSIFFEIQFWFWSRTVIMCL